MRAAWLTTMGQNLTKQLPDMPPPTQPLPDVPPTSSSGAPPPGDLTIDQAQLAGAQATEATAMSPPRAPTATEGDYHQLQEQFPRPSTFQQARDWYLGRKVRDELEVVQGSEEYQWYLGQVVEIYNCYQDEETGQDIECAPGEFVYRLEYPPGPHDNTAIGQSLGWDDLLPRLEAALDDTLGACNVSHSLGADNDRVTEAASTGGPASSARPSTRARANTAAGEDDTGSQDPVVTTLADPAHAVGGSAAATAAAVPHHPEDPSTPAGGQTLQRGRDPAGASAEGRPEGVAPQPSISVQHNTRQPAKPHTAVSPHPRSAHPAVAAHAHGGPAAAPAPSRLSSPAPPSPLPAQEASVSVRVPAEETVDMVSDPSPEPAHATAAHRAVSPVAGKRQRPADDQDDTTEGAQGQRGSDPYTPVTKRDPSQQQVLTPEVPAKVAKRRKLLDPALLPTSARRPTRTPTPSPSPVTPAATTGQEGPVAGAEPSAGTEVADRTAGEAMEQQEGSFRSHGLSGHLKKVVVVDFMCHKNLEVEFGPHVTLISGANGSGKSAVLQALQVCLGASARQTLRGSQLSSFVRKAEGVTKAQVKVTLWNEGHDAYRPEVYGKEITIERAIRKAGGGEYRIYGSAQGRSKQKASGDELKALLTHFNINASNPFAIITQDMAKTFHGSTTRDRENKFQYYMEGTQLEVTETALAEVVQRLNDMTMVVRSFRERVTRMGEDLKRLEAEREKAQDTERLKGLICDLENVAAWGACTQIDELLEQWGRELEQLRSVEPGLQSHTQKCERELQELVTLQSSKRGELERMEQELRQSQQTVRQVKEAWQATRVKRVQLGHQLERLQAQRQEEEANRDNYQQQLNEAEGSVRNNAALTACRQQLDQCTAQIAAQVEADSQLEQQLTAHRQQMSDVREGIRSLEQQKQQLTQQISGQLDPQVQRLQQELSDLVSQNTHRAALFGGFQVVRLQQELSRYQFRHPPIGPIGAYLSLADNRHARAAESVLGGLLNRFICFHSEDFATLRQLAVQVGLDRVDGYTVTAGVGRHDVDTHPACGAARQEGWTTLKDILRINHPDPTAVTAIFNLLVDKGRIERVVLTDTDEAAKDLVFAPHSQQLFKTHRFSAVGPSGDQRSIKGQGTTDVTYSRLSDRAALRLGSGLQQIRQQKETELQDLLQRRQGLQQQVVVLEHEIREKRTGLTALEQAVVRLTGDKRQIRQQLNQLDSQRSEINNQMTQLAGDQRVAVASQMLSNCTIKLTSLDADIQDVRARLETAMIEEQAAKLTLDQTRQRVDAPGDTTKLIEEIEDLVRRERDCRRMSKRAADALELNRVSQAQFERELEEHREQLKELEQQAEAHCSGDQGQASLDKVRGYLRSKFEKEHRRVLRPEGRSTQQTTNVEAEAEAYINDWLHPEKLAEEITRLQRRVTAHEKASGGDLEQLTEECEKLTLKLEKLTVRFDIMHALLAKLRQSYHKRVHKLEEIKESTVHVCQSAFNTLINRRNKESSGRLLVSYERKTLDTEVNLYSSASQSTVGTQQTKTLSGGERSYTTVSLLLAIAWRCEFPFHCLDEYDVFMDAWNRKLATELLLDFAAQHPHRQFVLLTPQAVGTVQEALEAVRFATKLKRHKELPPDFLRVLQMQRPRQL